MWKLYHYPWAPYARKALLAGYELDIAFEEVVTPAFDPKCMAELRAKTFPLATTPLLLLDDGTFLSESSLIIETFDLDGPEPGRLVPTDRHEAIRVRAFDRLADALLEPTHYLTWALRKPPAEMNNKRIAQMMAKVATTCGVLDQALAGRSFLFQDRFTMADIGAACAFSVLIADRSIERAYLDTYPNVRRWYDGLTERPAWRRMEACAERVGRPPELA